MRITPSRQPREQGAVSIFIVIFFSLLIGVITMSFVGIVVRGANQSTNNDLSRSAYDSAQAGVEDAKRAIAAYVNACNGGTGNCASYTGFINNQQCGSMPGFAATLGLRTGAGNEILVQSNTDTAFDQAYTCVNTILQTPDYINKELPQHSDVIPLKSTGAFSGVTVNWFTHTDGSLADTQPFTPRPNCSVSAVSGSSCTLPTQGNWVGNGTPALLRVQLISYNGGTIADSALQSNGRTLFLYPSQGGVPNGGTVSFDQDSNPPSAAAGAPLVPVHCLTTGVYSCSVNLGLGSNTGKTSFIRVTPIYKSATFQLQLTGGANPLFDGVQPVVDSTGRANDLFRRVEARVRMENNVLYPEYAVDVQNSFCKDYAVGADTADFIYRCP